MKTMILLVFLMPASVSGYEWTVCVDPGHGLASGTQCADGSFLEDDLNWEVGINLYDALKKELGEGNVSITRLADTRPSSTDRTQIGQGTIADAFGNRVRGDSTDQMDVFVSIHLDTWNTSSNGTHIYVNGEGDKDNPDNAPPTTDSSYAVSRDAINCMVVVTGQDWDRACAFEQGVGMFDLPSDGYAPPDDGIMGRGDLLVLNDPGWSGTRPWHGRCLVECEFMNAAFCEYLGESYGDYVDNVVDALLYAMKLYRQRADPGGTSRVVQIPLEVISP